jgi:hypothetical protein
MADTKKLDAISAVCFINRGPFLTDLDTDNIFSETNKLGSPIAMEINSSINGFYRYGTLLIYDEKGVRESFPITCNEIISIMYKNDFRDPFESLPNVIHFNIFDMEEVVADATQYNSKRFTGKLLKFHLVEAPFFLKYNEKSWKVSFGKSDTYDLPKSSKPSINNNGMFVHDIFYKHFKDHLNLISDDPKKDMIEVDFDKMKTKIHLITPSWKTQKILTYLLDFTKDENDYGNVKCFPTTNIETSRPIVHLKSLNKMFSDDKNVPTAFVLTNGSVIDGSINELGIKSLNTILSHRFLMYDLSALPSGFSGGSLLNYDYTTGEYFTHYDTYTESNKKKGNSYFSNFGLWSDNISNYETKQFYVGSQHKDSATSYLNNKVIKNKYQLRCEIVTYIDEALQVGDKIIATFPSGMSIMSGEKQEHLFDEHMTDEWIVEEITDKVENGKGMRKMICIKDSLFNIYGNPKGTGKNDYLPKVKYVNKK